LNGYGIGIGSPAGPDASDAVKFYQAVANQIGAPLQGNSQITVVGHSLGGGIAGLVGAIYGVKGVLFNNMTFDDAQTRLIPAQFPGTLFSDDGTHVTNVPADADLEAEFYGEGNTPYQNNLTHLSAYATSGEFLEFLLPARLSQTPSVQYEKSYSQGLSIRARLLEPLHGDVREMRSHSWLFFGS
jgi:pimeloyl-ACP methyl ester carboxylesterase